MRGFKNIHKPALVVITAVAVAIFLRASFPALTSAGMWDDVLLVLLLCTGILILLSLRNRIRQLLRRSPSQSPLPSKAVEEFFIEAPEERVFFFVRSLMGPRSRITEQGRSLFVQRAKGRVGAWGSILFHISILVLLAGLLLSIRFGERHRFALTEGETQEVIRGALTVELRKVDPEYRAGTAVTSASILRSGSGGEWEEATLYVNNSHAANAWVVHHTGTWGYAPELVILTSRDSLLLHAAVRLSSQSSRGGAFEDSIAIPWADAAMKLCLYPDFRRTADGDSSISTLPQNPVLTLALRQPDGGIATCDLALGQHVDAAGMRILFPRLRKWSRLEAVYDPGIVLLFWGCLLCVAGLLLRLLFTRRVVEAELQGTAAGTHVRLRGKCERYPCTLREELGILADRLRAMSDGEGSRYPLRKPSLDQE